MNADSIMTILQTSFLLNMKTGNAIFDSLLAIFVLMYVKKIFEFLPEIFNWIKDKVSQQRKISSEYMIPGTVTISSEYCTHYTNFPQEYKAVMYKISKLGIDISHGKQFNSNKNNDENNINNYMFSYSLNTNKEIKIFDNIFIRQTNEVNKSNDLKCSIEFYNLFIYSYKYTFIELKNIIDDWIKEYKKYIKEYNDGNIYYFSYLGKELKNLNKNIVDKICFESHKFYSNKSFDNIFFEDKEKLVKRLNYFINNENNYKKLGIPYTFGLLFYGYPGCGKTSTIKAIANYTKRHIIEIPLSKIKTCRELKKIFFDEIINGHYIPSDKKIIVLEDIDCMGTIVQKRKMYDDNNVNKFDKLEEIDDKSIKNNINGSNKMELYDKFIRTIKDHNDNNDGNDDNDDKLTLSYILNLIDGVLEQKGRIMIITTNHPEKIDEALLRPGRIDMKIHFQKCSKAICKQIIEFYLDTKIDNNVIEKLKDVKFTPAEVFQICLNHNKYDTIIKCLTS